MLNSFAYHHSPIWAQESLIAAKSAVRNWLREGRRFGTMSATVEESQRWSARELHDYQSRMLHAIVASAATDVPYYRDRLRPYAQDISRLPFPELMANLPMLTKHDVREAGKALISGRKRGPVFSSSTSGTSGTPLSLFQDLPAINRENAFIWRQLAWAGHRRGDRRVWMRGDMIVPAAQQRPPFWRFNRVENMLMVSSYHLGESVASAYLEAITRFDPVVIQAYPSSIGFLATWMQSAGVAYAGKALRGIVTSSESLPDEARKEIERAFGARVFDWYGQGERVAAIGTCEHGQRHLMSDYSYVEMLPADDGLFELVGTGFNNWSMPLIRYRCGDFVRLPKSEVHCECGRAFPVIAEVLGRADDAIKLPDGRSIGRLDHIFKGLHGILESQIRQDKLDTVTLLVVPAATFSDRIKEGLVANARERLGPDVTIDVRMVQAVPRTRNGKLKGVVCNV